MTWPSLCCVLGSVVLLLAFLGAVVFVEPDVYFGSKDLDFCGLTAVFFTLDMFPLVFLLFSNDAKVSRIFCFWFLFCLTLVFVPCDAATWERTLALEGNEKKQVAFEGMAAYRSRFTIVDVVCNDYHTAQPANHSK